VIGCRGRSLPDCRQSSTIGPHRLNLDRLPKLLFVTSLPQPQWGRLATERMQKDLGAAGLAIYLQAGLPPLRRLRLDKIQRKILNVHTRVQCDPGAYVTVQGKPRRIATIGRTFLDAAVSFPARVPTAPPASLAATARVALPHWQSAPA